MRKTGCFFILVAALHACTSATNSNPRIDFSRNALTVQFYEGGSVSKEKVLEPGSRGARVIAEIVENKHRQWAHSFDTFAPRVLVRGSDFTVNFQRGLVIADFTREDGKSDQLVAPLAGSEFAEVNSLRDK